MRLRRGVLATLRIWLDPRLGGLALVTPAWIALLSFRFAGAPDLLLLLPALGFWCAWSASRLMAVAARMAAALSVPLEPRVQRRFMGALLLGIAVVGAVDGAGRFRVGTTLSQQLAMVRGVTDALAPYEGVATFEAEALLVLSERSSMAPFLRTSPIFMKFSQLVGADDCADALARVLERGPALIAIYRWVRERRCVTHFENRLRDDRYRHHTLTMELPLAPGLADRRYPERRLLRWQIYTRTQ